MKGVRGTEYIHKDKRYNNSFFISKKVNGIETNFGSYSSLQEAKKWRDYFEKNGWAKCLDERLSHSSRQPKYIVYLKDKKLFRIVKKINGKAEVFGHFKNYSDAEKEVKMLKKHNWEWQDLCDGEA